MAMLCGIMALLLVPSAGDGVLSSCGRPGANAVAIRSVDITPKRLRLGGPVSISISGISSSGIDARDLLIIADVWTCERPDNCLAISEKYRMPFCKAAQWSQTNCSLMEPGEHFLLSDSFTLPSEGMRSSYGLKIEVQNPDGEQVGCAYLSDIVVFASSTYESFSDGATAVVAFIVAASSSRSLGKYFPKFTAGLLPQITGFLFMGIVVGPFCTNLVTQSNVAQIGSYINHVSLAFISGAAGAELFLPELNGLKLPILIQVLTTSAVPLIVCPIGLYLCWKYSLTSVPPLSVQSTFQERASVSLLAGVLMVAKSPASAIAIISEMGCGEMHMARTALGVTVCTDVVVMVLYALGTSIVHVAEKGGNLSLSIVLGVCSTLFNSLVFAVVSTQLQRVIIRSTLGTGPRGAALLVILTATYEVAGSIESWSQGVICMEPILTCILASCICGHDRDRRDRMLEALSVWTPWVLLPFFTLAGASLELSSLLQTLPAAAALASLRLMSTAIGSISGGLLTRVIRPDQHLSGTEVQCTWMTMLAQAGVTLGLVLEVKRSFGAWAQQFATLIIGVVVINQLVGPVFCRIGFQLAVKAGKQEREATHTPANSSLLHADSMGSAPSEDETPLHRMYGQLDMELVPRRPLRSSATVHF